MIRLDRDALICDLAETYGIYDMESLPIKTVAILSCGLREDSRIKQKLSANPLSIDSLLLAHAVDRLGILIWQRTKDGQHGRNRPESFVEKMMESKTRKKVRLTGFESVEEYEEAKNMILRRAKHA